jgi:hypothetical protein
MDELIRFVEGMALGPPGVGDGKVTDVQFIDRPKGGGQNIVVLDRIEPDFTPDYCTHGRATCITCDEWVWLGHNTHEVVASKQAYPMCLQCAKKNVAQEGTKYMGRITDHRRADGPHD